MLTDEKRKDLSARDLIDHNAIGYDCDGNFLKIGNTVEVIKEEVERKGNSAYEFAGVGKKGIIVKNGIGGFTNYLINIEFQKENGSKDIVGCIDYYLRIWKNEQKEPEPVRCTCFNYDHNDGICMGDCA
jgi:hypothetical protein